MIGEEGVGRIEGIGFIGRAGAGLIPFKGGTLEIFKCFAST